MKVSEAWFYKSEGIHRIFFIDRVNGLPCFAAYPQCGLVIGKLEVRVENSDKPNARTSIKLGEGVFILFNS